MNLLLNPYFQTDLRRSFFVFYYTAHRLVAANHRLVGANYRLAAANHCLVEANEGYAALAFALMRYWAAQTTCFSMLHRSVSLKISHRRLNSYVFLTIINGTTGCALGCSSSQKPTPLCQFKFR